jgi:pimeloyl-ACP methyl ester carboxylesterase
VTRVADWTFDGTWPFDPQWFDSHDGRMHYVDVGPKDGRPVVMVHGNPTWGYLYRNFIPALAEAGHRAIVPDHLGFGRSDKPPDPELYRVPRHAERLDALLESLDLRGATVVPQDWGGPVGLYWATRHPERVDGLFILNTYAHGFRREALPPGKDKVPDRSRCGSFARRSSESSSSRASTPSSAASSSDRASSTAIASRLRSNAPIATCTAVGPSGRRSSSSRARSLSRARDRSSR